MHQQTHWEAKPFILALHTHFLTVQVGMFSSKLFKSFASGQLRTGTQTTISLIRFFFLMSNIFPENL